MEPFTSYPSNPLFKVFSKKEWETIIREGGASRRTFSKDELVFASGTVTHWMGVVEKGSVQIEFNDPWGNKNILSSVAVGEVFAETYAYSGEPLRVDVVSTEDSSLLLINLKRLLDEDNSQYSWYFPFLHQVLRQAMNKNKVLSNRIFCTQPKSIRGRVQTYLGAVAAQQGTTTFQIPFDRQQLADYLNVERSALSKELGKMRTEGLIDFYKNSFKLTGTQSIQQ